MKIKHIVKIPPKPSKCISVNNTNKLFALKNGVLTHNSVAQQNIIISCLLRPEHWIILGIDLKRVELSRYRKYGMKVATELGVALEFLRFAQAVMMKRYEVMEENEVNNFRDLEQKQQAIMVMIDEAGELLSASGGKSDEAKADDTAKEECKMIIGSIARLGRAAGVHLIVATQRPDASLIPGETRDNLGVRIVCGILKPSGATMMLGGEAHQALRLRTNPPGAVYVQINGKGNPGQGFFAPNDWLEKYYATIGQQPNQAQDLISDLNETQERTEKINHLDSWDEDQEELFSLREVD